MTSYICCNAGGKDSWKITGGKIPGKTIGAIPGNLLVERFLEKTVGGILGKQRLEGFSTEDGASWKDS